MDGGPDATTSLKTPGVKPRPGAAPPGRSPSRGAFCSPGLPEHHTRQPREAPDLAGHGTTRSLAGFPQPAVGGRNAQTLLDGDGMSSPGTARSGSRENPGALCPPADPAWRAWRGRGCQGMPPHRSRGPAVRSATRVLPGARLALASPGPPHVPGKGHSPCNTHALSFNTGPASFPGHSSAPLQEARGLPSEALVAGS